MTFAACNPTRRLAEGQQLYDGAEVKVKTPEKDNDGDLASELNLLVRPRPNAKLLGWRYKLWFWNLVKQPTGKGLRYFIRQKLGEPPVLASELNLEKNREVLVNRLENNGYFQAVMVADTTVKKKIVKAHFNATTGPQYKYQSVAFPDGEDTLSAEIRRTEPETFLKTGEPYDLGRIELERIRIDEELKNRGFFFFSPAYLLALIDTTEGTHEVVAKLKIKEKTPTEATNIYKINDVWIYSDYTIEKDSIMAEAPAEFHETFYTIDPEHKYKSKVFEKTLTFKPGDIYSRKEHNRSLNRLSSLGTFKFVKTRFEEVDTAGSYMDPYFFLTPLAKKSLRFEITGLTKSNNATGGEVGVTWRNRNFLHGAELFTVGVTGGLEQQISGNVNVSTVRFGAEVNLFVPRIVGPFDLGGKSESVPRTHFTLAYEYYQRTTQYTLNSYRGSYGYIWKPKITIEEQLDPININFVQPTNITDDFQAILDTNLTLARSIQKQFIIGPTYNFNFNSLAKPNLNRSNFYFNANVDLSGNVVGLVTGSSFQDASKKPGTIFGTPFSQYARLELEGRHYFKIGDTRKDNQIASRLLVGSGYAYGNSDDLPFVKQFFIGGTNSLRAWRARSLGPGTYYLRNFRTTGLLPDQPGDIKLEMNTELRHTIFSIVKGALFFDAGNIWTRKVDPQRPGSQFTSSFLNQLAVGGGYGLRFDLSFLVLRIDLATPLRKPYLKTGPAWVLDKIALGDANWRRENLVLNLAIGYPF